MIANCIICGKEFVGRDCRQLCCSDKCSKERNRQLTCVRHREEYRLKHAGELKKCKNCGKEITASWRRSFCSDECSDAYAAKRYKGKSPKIKHCVICGKEFRTVKRERDWCSEECRLLKHRPRKPPKPKPKKPTFDEIIRQADECGLSYGKYRAALRAGKTYVELRDEKKLRDEKITSI